MLVDEGCVREVARQGVEDAAANGGLFYAEIVAMEQVVRGYVVEAGHGFLAVAGEYATDDEIDDHAPHCA